MKTKANPLAALAALHKLRSRQEDSELRYWLSFLAYNSQDKSLSNRLYLVYLLIFLAVMMALWLLYLAQGIAKMLGLFSGVSPQSLTLNLQAGLLLLWGVWTTWKSMRSSPLKLREEDATLLCLQPVKPQVLVSRWFWMPWLKALLPILLIFAVLAYGLAERQLTNPEPARDLPIYLSYGLRSLRIGLPFHLLISLMSWVFGLLAMRRRKNLLYSLPSLLLILSYLLILAQNLSQGGQGWLSQIFEVFSLSSPLDRSSLLWVWLACGLALSLLWLIARGTSPSQAAYETAEESKIGELKRYGFSSAAGSIQARKRLGTYKRSQVGSKAQGFWALVHKTSLQFRRAAAWQLLQELALITFSWLACLLVPDFLLKLFTLAIFVYKLHGFAVQAMREDLRQWLLLRLTPSSLLEIAVANLLLPYLLVLGVTLPVSAILALRMPGISWTILPVMPLLLAGVFLSFGWTLSSKLDPEYLALGKIANPVLLSVLVGTASALPAFLALRWGSGLAGLALAMLISALVTGLAFLILKHESRSLGFHPERLNLDLD